MINEQNVEKTAADMVAFEVQALLTNIAEDNEGECFGAWTENGEVYDTYTGEPEKARQRAKELSKNIEADVDSLIQTLYGNVLV